MIDLPRVLGLPHTEWSEPGDKSDTFFRSKWYDSWIILPSFLVSPFLRRYQSELWWWLTSWVTKLSEDTCTESPKMDSLKKILSELETAFKNGESTRAALRWVHSSCLSGAHLYVSANTSELFTRWLFFSLWIVSGGRSTVVVLVLPGLQPFLLSGPLLRSQE